MDTISFVHAFSFEEAIENLQKSPAILEALLADGTAIFEIFKERFCPRRNIHLERLMKERLETADNDRLKSFCHRILAEQALAAFCNHEMDSSWLKDHGFIEAGRARDIAERAGSEEFQRAAQWLSDIIQLAIRKERRPEIWEVPNLEPIIPHHVIDHVIENGLSALGPEDLRKVAEDINTLYDLSVLIQEDLARQGGKSYWAKYSPVAQETTEQELKQELTELREMLKDEGVWPHPKADPKNSGVVREEDFASPMAEVPLYLGSRPDEMKPAEEEELKLGPPEIWSTEDEKYDIEVRWGKLEETGEAVVQIKLLGGFSKENDDKIQELTIQLLDPNGKLVASGTPKERTLLFPTGGLGLEDARIQFYFGKEEHQEMKRSF